MYYNDLINKLRIRAEIRRKTTCRGPDDRIANELDEAAQAIFDLLKENQLLRTNNGQTTF